MPGRRGHARIGGRRGTAAVETAVLLPILTLLVLGVCELGWYVYCAQVLNNAARQGARAAAHYGNSNAEVEAAVHDSLSNSVELDAHAITVRLAKLSANGEEHYQILDLSDNEQGEPIRVTVSVDYGEIGFATNMLGLDMGKLSGYAVMRRRQ